jgi:hypothetical protein
MEHLTAGFRHNQHRAPPHTRPAALARQGGTDGSDPAIVRRVSAGRGQSLIRGAEAVCSGSLAPGTADGASEIEFFEFDRPSFAWQLNRALMRGLTSRELGHALAKPAQTGVLICGAGLAVRAIGRDRRLVGRVDRPSFRR